MLRALSTIGKAAVEHGRIIDRVTLDHTARRRRRLVVRGESGASFLIDLEKSPALCDGDALCLEDGTLLHVQAAAEALLEITADRPLLLLRLAWHIGNRHTAAEIEAHAIYIAEDHVLAAMATGLGCDVRPVRRPFQPEAGAYAGAGHHHAEGP
jgi:urease accessory protein